jgi:hypothetical protein
MASSKGKRKRKPSRAVVKTDSTAGAVTTTNRNYFELYGESVEATTLVGELLKFQKGKYVVGRGEKELPENTKLVADMNLLRVGYVRWENQRPSKSHMGLIVEGFNPGPRKLLGDLDESLWEKFTDGKPKDPWSFSNELVLFNPKDPDELYTFVTSSKGGISAVAYLAKQYGLHMRQAADELPLVDLAVGGYAHKNKSFGKIKVPVLVVAGWVDTPKKTKRLTKTASKRLAASKANGKTKVNGKTKAKTVKKAMVVKPIKEPSLPVRSKRSDDVPFYE